VLCVTSANIPLLVAGFKLPAAALLPPDLRLAFAQAACVLDQTFPSSCGWHADRFRSSVGVAVCRISSQVSSLPSVGRLSVVGATILPRWVHREEAWMSIKPFQATAKSGPRLNGIALGRRGDLG
jgi:hypothetical protein